MAGGGKRGSTRANSQPPPSFTAACQKIVKFLKLPGLRVVGVCGWDGVGRRRLVRHVADMFGDGVGTTTTSSSNEVDNSDLPPSFAHILRLSEQEDHAAIGRRVEEMLRSARDDAGEPFGEYWWEPLTTLPRHATLVAIEQDLRRPINLDAVFGFRSIIMRPEWQFKIVVPLGLREPAVVQNMIVAPLAIGRRELPPRWWICGDSFDSLTEEEAWELLRHEADEMADELCLPFLTGDIIMECVLYTALSPGYWSTAPVHTYLWGEGLVHPSTTAASAATDRWNATEYNFDVCKLLITKFEQRGMFGDDFEYPSGLRSKVRTIATTLYQSPPSRIKKKGRFMVAIDEGLEELPEGMEGWDQQGITRVFLSHNEINRLQWRRPPPPLLPSSTGSRHGTMSNIIVSPPKCENLSTFILSHNPLSEGIQDEYFFIMPNLRVLDLSYAERLQVLPTSITSLTNLRFLNLCGCWSLHTISPCLDDGGFPNLEILNIEYCPLQRMTVASFRQVPNLRLLVTDNNSLVMLEVLDISGTKIESLPELRDIGESDMFARLDLINTKRLSSVNWENFARVPAIVNWDQCGYCCTATSHSTSGTAGHFRMCVQDVEIFRSLSRGHRLWHRPFGEYFRIHVHPYCTNSQHQYRHPRRECPPSVPYQYLNHLGRKRGLNDHHQYHSNYDPPANWRYLHICGVSTPFTSPMEGVLPNMHSLQLCNHEFIEHLPVIHPMELRTCQVVKCPSMETIFYGRPTSELAHLESINLFHLVRLETLYKGSFGPTAGSFSRLRSVYIDNCPRMVTVFSSTPRSILLPELKELVIQSCGKLSEVFGRGAVGSTVAPALSDMYLWDLPELKNLCDGCLPSLRTLQLRGCARLRALPLPPVDNEGKPFKLDITAEHKWWENLNQANKKHIIFKPWSPWTSRS